MSRTEAPPVLPTEDVDDDRIIELHGLLAEVPGLFPRRGEPLCRHNALRTGGPADLWVVVDSPAQFAAVTRAASGCSVPISFDYPLSDRILKAGGLGGLVIRPGQGFEQLGWVEASAEAKAEGEDGPLLEIGSACPFARAAGLGGTWAALSQWPGTPGAWLGGPRWAALSDFIDSIVILRGKTETVLRHEDAGRPPEPGPRALLKSVRMRAPESLQLHRPPPPTGTLFARPAKLPGSLSAFLRDTGVVGSRLRAWRLEPDGTVSQQGGGTADDLLLFAKAIKSRLHALHGLDPDVFLPVLGRNPIRRSLRPKKPVTP